MQKCVVTISTISFHRCFWYEFRFGLMKIHFTFVKKNKIDLESHFYVIEKKLKLYGNAI